MKVSQILNELLGNYSINTIKKFTGNLELVFHGKYHLTNLIIFDRVLE